MEGMVETGEASLEGQQEARTDERVSRLLFHAAACVFLSRKMNVVMVRGI